MTAQAILRRARELARLPYTVELFPDRLQDGTVVYMAQVKEMPGCLAQGESREKAVRELNSVLVDLFAICLEDGIPAPQPDHPNLTAPLAGLSDESQDESQEEEPVTQKSTIPYTRRSAGREPAAVRERRNSYAASTGSRLGARSR